MADGVVASSASPRAAAADFRSGLAALLLNLLGYPLLVSWTLLGMVLFGPAFLGWKLVTGWSAGRIMRHFIWIYGRGWLLIMATFVRFRRQGFEGLDLSRPAIFVVNHQSFFDTYCMALLPVFDVTFAVRAWPFRMIWYGWFMRLAGYLDVESAAWPEIEAQGCAALDAGGHLLFFPEGHRSRDGRLQRFYNGAFQLALSSGRPIVPLCLQGTGQLLPPGRFTLRPATITLTALEPVDSRAFRGENAPRELRDLVRERLAAALDATAAEAQG